ncbi:hypothetical protein [Streptomyces sp. NPDC020681]|uniref:hypothetical protein n=1 Tax=Streptomyces sp. NPDC020681 TaxID=3365083 RepID=UPI00378D4BA6
MSATDPAETQQDRRAAPRPDGHLVPTGTRPVVDAVTPLAGTPGPATAPQSVEDVPPAAIAPAIARTAQSIRAATPADVLAAVRTEARQAPLDREVVVARPGSHPARTGTRVAPPPEDRQPTCGKASDPEFPIDSRIHGGPTVHRPGGGLEQWSVDLANTTGETCHNIHPVIIFAGRDPGLTPARFTLEFYDDDASRWRAATLETTTEDEVVGVLEDQGFAGFAVPARATLTVRVRLALDAGTPPNQVTVNAAVVQRRGDDGDWVGESGDYRFAVLDDDGSGTSVTRDELATTGTGSLLRLGVALATVLACSGALVLLARRLRAGRR